LAATSGWSSGDIVNLKKNVVEKILDDPQGKHYGFFKRVKTNTDQYLCLTSETHDVLKTYIQTLPKNQEWLFEGYKKPTMLVKAEEVTKTVSPLAAGRLDEILKDLCAKAGIESKNQVLQPIRFHGLRQSFSSRYGGRYEIKELCMGHTPRFAGAYSPSEQEIWSDFKAHEESLRIQQTNGNSVKKLIAENLDLKQRVDALEASLEPFRELSPELIKKILEEMGKKDKESITAEEQPTNATAKTESKKKRA
jgi:hypothetical protein